MCIRDSFNPGTTVAMITQARPNITPAEMRAARAWMTQAYAQTVFIVGSDNQAFLKNLPHIKTQAGQPSTTETATWKGQWSSDGTNYDLTLSSNGENKFMSATTDGTRLTIKDGREDVYKRQRLARHLSAATDIPLNKKLLRRVSPTATQTLLTREQRAANMRGAFAVRGGMKLNGEKIVLIDDVFTTGATTSECAKALRKAGAGDVCVWTVARGL